MLKVKLTKSTKYHGEYMPAYSEFVIEDKDKDAFVGIGATIIESIDKKIVKDDKKVEPKKVVEPKKEEIKEDK